MRIYQPIWETLKKNHVCKLAAAPELHKRIKKAVIKEKYNDTAFKVECEVRGIFLELHIESKQGMLTFRLIRSKIGIGDL